MTKKYLFTALFVFIATLTFAQGGGGKAPALKESTWKMLSKITFRKEYDELLGMKVDVPVYSREVQSMEGKEITIRGYIIPTDGYKSSKEFVFSAFPYSMCFFCGGAGPETVMEVSAKEGIKYTPDPVILKGILKLNKGDVNQLIYSLKGAVKEDGARQ